MRKVFRISKNELSEAGKQAFHPLWYRIEQRYTFLFFIHWWGTPTFAPPHYFEKANDAYNYIKKHYPKAVIYDNHSGNNTQCK